MKISQNSDINADLMKRLNEDNKKKRRDFDIVSKMKVSTPCF